MAISTIGQNGLAQSRILTTVQQPAGAVLQVVNVQYGVEAANSTTTYADTGLSASITPSSTSSKILIMVDHPGNRKTNVNTRGGIRLMRGSTVLSYIDTLLGYNQANQDNAVGSSTCTYLDSPATTSSITYKTQFAVDGAGGGSFYVFNYGTIQSTGAITLMEIAA